MALGLIAFIAMAMQSHKRPTTLGLQHGQLRPCPESPNCVCSEAGSRADSGHGVAPIPLHNGTWAHLKAAIIEQGDIIDQDDGHYLHATFTSPLFRFVDDVELRLDAAAGVIHIRSASRVGRSDLGVNRQRIKRITAALDAM